MLAGAGAVSGVASYAGEYRFDQITLKSSAGLTASDPLKSGDVEVYGSATRLPAQLQAASMTINAGSVAVAAAASGVVDLTVSGTLDIQAGAHLDVSAQGYAGATAAGGSGAAPAGVVYDSVYQPQLAGGGGSLSCGGTGYRGGAGGGVVALTVGTLQLDGQILARGETRSLGQAGGAGGSVLVQAATIAGAGSIDVSGGQGDYYCPGGGVGGGGRVALVAATFTGFNPLTQVTAYGAQELYYGQPQSGLFAGPGTVFWKDSTVTYGRLLVDSGQDSSGNDRKGPVTPLPALGGGAVTAWSAAGGGGAGNVWLSGAAGFGGVWLGAWVQVLDASGNLLGEFQVAQIDGQGRALLAGAGAVGGAASYAGEYRFDQITLKSSAGLTASDPLKSGDVEVYGSATRLPAQLQTTNMTINAPAVAVAAAANGVVDLTVTGTLDIQAGAHLDVSAQGYAGATAAGGSGAAPAGVAVSQNDAGGSHGGAGAPHTFAGPAGAVYDSVYQPQLAGGGGSLSCGGTGYRGGGGGGVVALTVGTLQLDGQILARGETRSLGQAGGAGGSVVVQAATIAGAGSIDVSGGQGDYYCPGGGVGGGGRVALVAATFAGFNPLTQVTAYGAQELYYGQPQSGMFAGPGTVFWKDSTVTYGRLLVDSGKDGSGNDRKGPVTPLPALGGGAITAWSAAGGGGAGNVWLSAAAGFGGVWLGAWVEVLDASGDLLGEFQVAQIDGQGRALLAGAGAVSGAASYAGEYRFDQITLKSSAGLTASDPLRSGDVEVYGSATRLPAQLQAASMTINAGSVAVASAAGGVVDLAVSGTLDIQAGAHLDVSAQGYAGATAAAGSGAAPAGVSVSQNDAGGSHGGAGAPHSFAGPAGAVYDSVYLPVLGGGGGSLSCGGTGYRGGAGGGAVALTVGTLQLDGAILARGETRSLGQAGGAGGSVLVQAATIAGAGSIDVSGGQGDYYCPGGGVGGGGRVALYATTLSGFNPATQALAHGAQQLYYGQPQTGLYAGSGTIFWKSGGATYGRLDVDSGLGSSVTYTLPITPLPGIGRITVGTAAADAVVPANLWITASGGALFQVGLAGMWVRDNGVDYPVIAQSADRTRIELAGAAASVAAGDTVEGVYKFDEVDVHGAARLQFNDVDVVGTLVVDPNSIVIQDAP